MVFVGAVRSTRICVPAVFTVSALPAASTEKYLMVNVPDVDSTTDVPWADAVVGADPFVV